MGVFLGGAFILIPIIELLVFIQVGDRIGIAWLIVSIVTTAVVGAFLVRSQGFLVWRRIQEDLAAGVLPGHQLVHGAMVLVGGALLLTPGFLTDAIGFVLMVPQLREGIRRTVADRLMKRRIIVIK